MVQQLNNFPWENWSGENNVKVQNMYFPFNVGEITECINLAEAQGYKIHAYGSGWSFSNAPICTQAMINTDKLNKLLMLKTVDKETGNSILLPSALSGKYGLALVESGIKINSLYDTLAAFGTALPTFGGSAGQSLAGVLATGSHGGDLTRKPLADWVHAIHLVGERGKQYWIERESSGRLVDESKLKSASFWSPDIEIIRDEDMLNAAVIACGRMGVIYSMLVETVPMYYLNENRTLYPWAVIQQTAAQGLTMLEEKMRFNNQPLHFLQILRSLDRDYPTCFVTRRATTNSVSLVPRPPDPDLKLDVFLHHSDWIGILSGDQATLGSRLNGLSNDNLRAIMAYVYSHYLAPHEFQGPYWYVMDGGDGQLRVQSAEYAFDAQQDGYFAFIDEVLAFARSPQVPGLIALRYTPKSDGLLALSRFEQTVHTEIAVPRGYNGIEAFFDRVENSALSRGGVAHPGQRNYLSYQQMCSNFGTDLQLWRTALNRVSCRLQNGTFSNEFSRKRGLEPVGSDNLLLFG